MHIVSLACSKDLPCHNVCVIGLKGLKEKVCIYQNEEEMD